MTVDPAPIRRTAQIVARRHPTGAVEVRTTSYLSCNGETSYVSCNGRPHAPFVDPDVDLVALDPQAPLATWLLPPRSGPPRTNPR
jgi:hypothetical protein